MLPPLQALVRPGADDLPVQTVLQTARPAPRPAHGDFRHFEGDREQQLDDQFMTVQHREVNQSALGCGPGLVITIFAA
jgi:hypothetical protein